GSILPGYHADIVVWKPEAQFHLDDTHAVYHKHRVRFPTPKNHETLHCSNSPTIQTKPILISHFVCRTSRLT
uniref:Amidohydrolase-related domain-containing protein n=1 Tax=Aegilops tauschii subsp. strangulata TaxID=200361 RepID=A0A453DGM4_AEGTS